MTHIRLSSTERQDLSLAIAIRAAKAVEQFGVQQIRLPRHQLFVLRQLQLLPVGRLVVVAVLVRLVRHAHDRVHELLELVVVLRAPHELKVLQDVRRTGLVGLLQLLYLVEVVVVQQVVRLVVAYGAHPLLEVVVGHA